MSRNRKHNSQVERWLKFDELLQTKLPSFCAWSGDEDEFLEFRVKAMPDGTTLAVAKGLNGSGGKIVCFGVGYGVTAALLAIESSIQGGNWREDKPWEPGKE